MRTADSSYLLGCTLTEIVGINLRVLTPPMVNAKKTLAAAKVNDLTGESMFWDATQQKANL